MDLLLSFFCVNRLGIAIIQGFALLATGFDKLAKELTGE
jgi:hypothetical protein